MIGGMKRKPETEFRSTAFPNGVWEREVSLVISFPTSRHDVIPWDWERITVKLCFTAMELEKQVAMYGVPKQSLGTRRKECMGE